MAATNTTRTVGTENTPIKVGLGLTVTSDATSTTTASDTTVSGLASAIARTLANAGVLNSPIQVGTNGTLTGSETGTVSATATNTTGNSNAFAFNSGPTGGFISTFFSPNIIQTGLKAVVVGSAKNTATADANTVGSSSEAKADTGKVAGFQNVGLAAGTGSSMTGSAVANSKATATAVGDPLSPGSASATAGSKTSLIKGIYNDDGNVKISFGEDGKLTGTAIGDLSATTKNTNGAANAAAMLNKVAGIANDGKGLDISTGLNGDVVASGKVKTEALATTVTGPAQAVVDITTIGGLIDRTSFEDSSLTIGKSGTLTALAVGQNTAKAEAVTTAPTEQVSATIHNDEVIAVKFPKIAFGTDATVSAKAGSIQEATAKGVNNGGDPSASVGSGDRVLGLYKTNLSVGQNLAKSPGEASLIGIATATGISSVLGSNASSGEGSTVAGVLESPILVGQDTAGIGAIGGAGLQSSASNVTGPAKALAGDRYSSVSGLKQSDVSIGQSGNVAGTASGLVITEANTVSGPSQADSIQTGKGIADSTIKIGLNGQVDGSSALGGSADSSTTTGSSRAMLVLNSVGIDLHPSHLSRAEDGGSQEPATMPTQPSITIGSDGAVNGLGLVDDTSVTGSAITGPAEALTGVNAVGIDLPRGGAVKIGNKGSVSGEADAGKSEVMATTTTGPATALGRYDVAGIRGSYWDTASEEDGSPLIQAGPQGGNILGKAVSEADLSSSATTGDTSTNSSAQIYGINNVNLKAGLLGGANFISGRGEGVFNASSTTVTGDASAASRVDVGGLLGYGNTATVDGNVSGIATLTNTVLDTTVSGIATASASSSAVGIGGYDIQILKDGVITASAITNSTTTANSVMAVV